MHLVGIGGNENDRRMRGFFAIADQRGSFQPIESGHVDVQQDDCELMLEDQLERFLTRVRGKYGLSKLLRIV